MSDITEVLPILPTLPIIDFSDENVFLNNNAQQIHFHDINDGTETTLNGNLPSVLV